MRTTSSIFSVFFCLLFFGGCQNQEDSTQKITSTAPEISSFLSANLSKNGTVVLQAGTEFEVQNGKWTAFSVSKDFHQKKIEEVIPQSILQKIEFFVSGSTVISCFTPQYSPIAKTYCSEKQSFDTFDESTVYYVYSENVLRFTPTNGGGQNEFSSKSTESTPLPLEQKFNNNQSDTTSTRCADSDGGNAPFIFGSVESTSAQGTKTITSDACSSDGNSLQEASCGSLGVASTNTVPCQNGCAEGACKNISVPSGSNSVSLIKKVQSEDISSISCPTGQVFTNCAVTISSEPKSDALNKMVLSFVSIGGSPTGFESSATPNLMGCDYECFGKNSCDPFVLKSRKEIKTVGVFARCETATLLP